MLYSSVQDALTTLHTQRVEGGLRAQWLFLVDISFFFPWVCSKVFVFWHSRLPCSPLSCVKHLLAADPWFSGLLLKVAVLLLGATAPPPQGGFWQLQERQPCCQPHGSALHTPRAPTDLKEVLGSPQCFVEQFENHWLDTVVTFCS